MTTEVKHPNRQKVLDWVGELIDAVPDGEWKLITTIIMRNGVPRKLITVKETCRDI